MYHVIIIHKNHIAILSNCSQELLIVIYIQLDTQFEIDRLHKTKHTKQKYIL